MKSTLLHFFLMLAIVQPALSKEKIMPLEERLGRNWNSVTFAHGVYVECSGFRTSHGFTIARDSANKMTISTKVASMGNSPSVPKLQRPTVIITPPVSLSADLYEAIIKDFLEHLRRAEKEMSIPENLEKYPPPMEAGEIRKRMATNGETASEESPGSIVVIFNTGKPEEVYKDAFAKTESINSYANWIQSYRRYAAPMLVK
jgi:hypothetical protein